LAVNSDGRVLKSGGFNSASGFTNVIDTYNVEEDLWDIFGTIPQVERAFHISEVVPEETVADFPC